MTSMPRSRRTASPALSTGPLAASATMRARMRGLAQRLGEEVEVSRTRRFESLGPQVIEHHHHEEQHPARPRRRHRRDRHAAVAAAERAPDDGPGDQRQVVGAQEAVVGTHVGVHLLGNLTPVEGLRAPARDGVEHVGELWLPEGVARLVRGLPVLEEVARPRTPGDAAEVLQLAFLQPPLERGDRVALPGDLRGRIHHLRPRQATVATVQPAERRGSARNGGGAVPEPHLPVLLDALDVSE